MANGSADPFARHEVRELTGHKKKVHTVGWNNNGKRLASGSDDGIIKIWRLDSRHGRPERSEADLVGHAAACIDVKWDPTTADRLASISNDKTVRLWDARSSRCLGTVKVAAQPLYIAWKPDGSELLCLDQSDTISVISAKTCKMVRKHKHSAQVNEVFWSPDGKLWYLAVGGGAIEVLEYPSFQRLRSVVGHGHSAHIYHLCQDPSGRYLASGATDAIISLWDTTDMVCVRTFTGTDDDVSQMSFSSDSRYLAYADHLGIAIMDLESGHTVRSVPTGGDKPASIEWNPRHLVLAWPAMPTADYRGEPARDSGPICVLAPA